MTAAPSANRVIGICWPDALADAMRSIPWMPTAATV
jgi:hypothetical protein